MASKVLVPAAPFAKLKVQKSPQEPPPQGFIIGSDAPARVAHLEHSVRFLQDQHRLMLSGLHNEIEALRERNRDLQFQLIFNKESASKNSSPNEDKENTTATENSQREVESLKAEVAKLKHEAATARSEARAAEARAIQLQRLIDLQAEKLRENEVRKPACTGEHCESLDETRSELRARLADAERLVRRLRSDAERQRRELQCMKNSLHASLRASGMDYGYQQNYHFPTVHPDYFREEPVNLPGRNVRQSRRVLTLPELAGQPIPRATVYANQHAHAQPPALQPQPRVNGYDKCKRPADLVHPHPHPHPHPVTVNMHDEPPAEKPNDSLSRHVDLHITKSMLTYPELKVVIAKMIPHYNVSTGPEAGAPRARPRRHHHRKHADHT